MQENASDILENDILRRWPEVLRALLKDHTTNRNIFWSTDMYEKEHGESYSFHHQITVEQITGDNGAVIRPRAVKSIEEQRYRIRDKAEVFRSAMRRKISWMAVGLSERMSPTKLSLMTTIPKKGIL